MLRIVAFICGSLVFAGDALGPAGRDATASAGQTDSVQQFVGTYDFAGGPEERRAVAQAIEAVLEDMNVLVRGVARDRLTASNRIPARISIRRDENVVTIAIDDRTYRAALGGPSVEVQSLAGEPVDLRHELHGSKLYQSFEGARGGRVNVFAAAPPDTLSLSVRVHSSSLPSDLQYKLTFRRRAP